MATNPSALCLNILIALLPQVIYNGRIVTPQSLLTKKSGFAQPPKPKESLVPLPPPAREITTISETAGGGSAAAMLAKKGAAMNASKRYTTCPPLH